MADIVQCGSCGMRVVSRGDGTCPSCHGTLDAETALAILDSPSEGDAPPQSSPEPDMDDVQWQQRRRRMRALGPLMVGCFLLTFVIGMVGGALHVAWNTEILDEMGITGRSKRHVAELLVMVMAPFLALAAQQFVKGRRLWMRDARLVLAKDPRPLVLYLRSFRDDGSGRVIKPHRKGITYQESDEETLVRQLRTLGPVIAIGRPGERLPELGAHRMYVSHAHWQDEIRAQLQRACLVVWRFGSSPGLWWEFRTMFESVAPEKIILWQSGGTLHEKLIEMLPEAVGDRIPLTEFVYFEDDWQPRPARTLPKALQAKKMYRVPPVTIAKWVLAVVAGIVYTGFFVWLAVWAFDLL